MQSSDRSYIFFQVFVAPPLYRPKPHWYHQGLVQIASRFSAVFSTNAPRNLKLLPSFSCQDLMPDGRHLTPVAGLHYVLHLFDQSEQLLSRSTATADSQLIHVQEQVRHHEDRMSYLENRHAGMQVQANSKAASDAEFDDWMQNRNDESWIVIQGLPRLSGVTRQEWPEAAKRQVFDSIKLVLNVNRVRLDFEILHVSNPFTLTTSGPTTYNVRLDSVYTAKRIRELFSGFHRFHQPIPKPPALKGVSYRNKITLETKIRIAIMRQLGTRYKDANKGASFKVRGYDPRPLLLTMPPRGSSERPRTYNFIQAVTTLPAAFDDDNLVMIYQIIGDRFRGKLRSLFVVLNDDDHDRMLELVKAKDRRPRFQAPVPTSSVQSTSGLVTGSGAGMEVEAQHAYVFPVETDRSREHDARVRKRREHERQPTPDHGRKGLKRNRLPSTSDSGRKSKRGKHHAKRQHRTRRSRSRSRSRSPSESGSRSPTPSRTPSRSPPPESDASSESTQAKTKSRSHKSKK